MDRNASSTTRDVLSTQQKSMAVGATKLDRLLVTNDGVEKLLCHQLAKIEQEKRKCLRGLLRTQAKLQNEASRRKNEKFLAQREDKMLRAQIDQLVLSLVQSSDTLKSTRNCTNRRTASWQREAKSAVSGDDHRLRPRYGQQNSRWNNNDLRQQNCLRHELDFDSKAQRKPRVTSDFEVADKNSAVAPNKGGSKNSASDTMANECHDPGQSSPATSSESASAKAGEITSGTNNQAYAESSDQHNEMWKSTPSSDDVHRQPRGAIEESKQRKSSGLSIGNPHQDIRTIPGSSQRWAAYEGEMKADEQSSPVADGLQANQVSTIPLNYYTTFKVPTSSYHSNKGFTRVGLRPITASFQRDQEARLSTPNARNRPRTAAAFLNSNSSLRPSTRASGLIQHKDKAEVKAHERGLDALLQIRRAISASARNRALHIDHVISEQQQESDLARHQLLMKVRRQRQKRENEMVTERVWKFIGTRPLSASLQPLSVSLQPLSCRCSRSPNSRASSGSTATS